MTVHFDSVDRVDVSEVALKAGSPAAHPYRKLGKRALDVLFVVISAPIVVPAVALLALALWLSGSRPFYAQPRIGRNGRIFRMWKLRTMVEDADRALAEYLAANPAARSEWERHQKLRHDPRITPLGAVLRKTSLDELPQLWNVLRGDMSLVGPRPILPEQVPLYPGSAYYTLRPGITGSWQVSDRNAVEFSSRAKFDTSYATQHSLIGDAVILLRTISVIFRGTGY